MNRFPSAGRLRAWLKANRSGAIREAMADAHAADAAAVLGDMFDDRVWQILRIADVWDAAKVYSHFPLDKQVSLASSGHVKEVADLLDHVPADDRADLFKRLDESLSEILLTHLSVRQRLETERLVNYGEGTVGAVMSTGFAAVPVEMTVREALDFVRREAPRKETVYAIYVIDEVGRLAGVVSLEDLVLSDPTESIENLMDRQVIFARAEEPRTVAADKIQHYDFLALPVINGGEKLVGIVTVDDVLDVAEEEATEDFHKMASIGQMGMSLKGAGTLLLYRARLPWLLGLVFMNIFSGAGIAFFEDTLTAAISLAFFLPLLIASGGNAGAQSATLMVRALATGEVRLPDWLRLLGREFVVALTLGVTMALAVGLVASVRAPEIIVVVTISMVAMVLFGSLLGMGLPFLLIRFKQDPATSSAPLVTSIADIGGIIIYFGIATWWLGDMI